MTPWFGSELRHNRLMNGLSLVDMSKALGVSSSFLCAVEKGTKKAPIAWKNKLPPRLAAILIKEHLEELTNRTAELEQELFILVANGAQLADSARPS